MSNFVVVWMDYYNDGLCKPSQASRTSVVGMKIVVPCRRLVRPNDQKSWVLQYVRSKKWVLRCAPERSKEWVLRPVKPTFET